AQRTHRLATQQVENLRRRGWRAYLYIVLGTQLQETLEPRGGVLRALPFVAVWQQQRQAADTRPLGFTRGNELVDHHLGTVGKIAELRFPDHQCFRRGGGVAILERQYCLFRQQRIVDIEIRLAIIQVLQRHITFTVFLVMQYRMAMREGTTTDVLAGETHREPLVDQRGVGERFRVAPVEWQGPGGHLGAVFNNF